MNEFLANDYESLLKLSKGSIIIITIMNNRNIHLRQSTAVQVVEWQKMILSYLIRRAHSLPGQKLPTSTGPCWPVADPGRYRGSLHYHVQY